MTNHFTSRSGGKAASIASGAGMMLEGRGMAGAGTSAAYGACAVSLRALSRPLTLLTSRNLQRFLVALIVLDIPLQLDTHFGYRDDVAELGSLGGFGVSVTTVALVALYAAWIFEIVLVRRGSRPAFRLSFPLTAYVLVSVLSVLVASDRLLASFEVWILLQTLLLFVYFASRVQSRGDVMFILRVLLIGLGVESAIILGLQAGLRFDVPGHPLKIEEFAVGAYSRIAGTLGSPNAAGGYISLLLAPALSVIAAPVGRWDKRLAWLAFGLGLGALVCTFSRGAWTAFVLSLAVIGGAMWQRGRFPLKALIALVVVILAVAFVFRSEIETRLLTDDGGAAIARVYLMQVAVKIIRNHPVLGVGANNFPLAMTRYFEAGEWLYTVHNKYLLICAEVGVGGLVAFVTFLISTIHRGWKVWKSNDQLLSLLSLGMTAGIVGHTSHLFVDLFRGRPGVQLLWLMASLIIAMSWMSFRGATARRAKDQATGPATNPNRRQSPFHSAMIDSVQRIARTSANNREW